MLTEMAGAGDAGIPTSLIAKARCVVIVPSLKKVALDGSTIRQDTDENKDLYGREIDNKALVTGKVAAPPAAQGFLNALSKY